MDFNFLISFHGVPSILAYTSTPITEATFEKLVKQLCQIQRIISCVCVKWLSFIWKT